MDQAKLDEMATVTKLDNLKNSVGVLPVSEYEDPGTADFLEKYADKAGDKKVPTSETASNYQGIAIIAQAMEVSGATDDPAKIRRRTARGSPTRHAWSLTNTRSMGCPGRSLCRGICSNPTWKPLIGMARAITQRCPSSRSPTISDFRLRHA